MAKDGTDAIRINTEEPCITDTFTRLRHLMTTEEQVYAVSHVLPKYMGELATEIEPAQPELLGQ